MNAEARKLATKGNFGFPTELARAAKDARKGERTKANIRIAVCHCLNKLSLADLTVSEICQAAKIAHGTFYIYFADRNILVGDVALRYISFVQGEMHRASQQEPADPMRAATATYVALFEQNPGLMKCLINHLDGFPEAKKAFQTLNRQWLENVVAATERRLALEGRSLAHDELMRRAYALGGMTDQYLTGLLLSNDPNMASFSSDRDAVIDTLNLLWRRGMEP
ncbi:TetR/AcrR family transcriptional regulator [Pseudohalocynthiibacter aestuariivivens]|jgi:TetR/AcrR family transcriptional regulator, ethionamide resistance regulator|uniref:TetR/AcrR family transcriptional regulator n=1 Tax=Pseudohalocynthiibacter aestuariivivens TaxID=1591409 RepID=A0ABV5JGQ5_9RHOB|nr:MULTISPECIES: TetR/AcrR family transcriptional regulator [Pseudohalocynthiibacter]MBS9718127.1 TetR/AcrR family transcriptional regulator [Pseudohalocynthiibacter aestuariivivens]MCK0103777.1 TetR/AcrR family transcriptional regulator [Pseudohalocynthiibacter sp. F2068]